MRDLLSSVAMPHFANAQVTSRPDVPARYELTFGPGGSVNGVAIPPGVYRLHDPINVTVPGWFDRLMAARVPGDHQ